MAEPTLSLHYEDFVEAVAFDLGWGRKDSSELGAADLETMETILASAQRLAYYPPSHIWSWMRPTASISVWPTTSSTLNGPLTTQDKNGELDGVLDASTTVTVSQLPATGGFLEEWMAGQIITIDGTDFTIVRVVSETVCIVDSPVTAADDVAVTVQVTSVRVEEHDSFHDSAHGKMLDIANTEYQILDITNSRTCHVSGDASGEADEATVTLTADGDYRMPDDFGGVEGPFTHAATLGHSPMPIVAEQQIRSLRRFNAAASRPQYAAVHPIAIDTYRNQRHVLMLYPVPNSLYVLTYRKILAVNKMTATAPYPLGGTLHAELLLVACLAVAEQRLNDEKGIRWQEFTEKLGASIALDQEATRGEYLGYNADHSDARRGRGITHGTGYNVTVGGVLPT